MAPSPADAQVQRGSIGEIALPLQRWTRSHLTGIGFGVVAALAAAVRLHAFDRASLWLDEGSTVYFSRLSWPDVLGLRGGYDTHPPLYYALVKGATLLVGEVHAGRLVSVVGGTIAVIALLLVAERLMGSRVALVAGLSAATAPLLVWYSQEARQYAVASAAVMAAYLALVAYQRQPRRWVAAGYFAAVVAAMYTDYSAAFALAPHLVVVAYLIVTQRRAALPLVVAGSAAVLAYLPWLPFVGSTVSSLAASRSGFLGVSVTGVLDAARSIVGVAGSGIYYATLRPPPWHQVPVGQAALGLVAAVVLAGGIASMASRPIRWLVAISLAFGTLAAAVVFSVVSPSFAPRTVSYAVFGWALILGAAAAGRIRLATWPRRGVRMASLALLVVPMLALPSVYAGEKQHFRELASDTLAVVEASGFPLLLHPTFTPALITAYQPAIERHLPTTVYDAPDSRQVAEQVGGAPAVIVSYMGVAGTQAMMAGLESAGLERVMHAEYFYLLALDIWARPSVVLGQPVPIDLGFGAIEWAQPEGASLAPQDSRAELELPDSTPGEEALMRQVPAASGNVYEFGFSARLTAADGLMRAFLICTAENGEFLTVSPDGGGQGIPPDGSWHAVRFAGYCPTGTASLRLDVRNAGAGALLLADPVLTVMSPPGHR